MFVVDCPDHGRRVLLPETRIRGLRNTATGILVEVECWCGAQLTIRTGRPRSALEPVSRAADVPPRRLARGYGSNL